MPLPGKCHESVLPGDGPCVLHGAAMKSPGPLDSEPFDFTETKHGLVQISYLGKVVTSLAGREAARFLARADGLDSPGRQRLMAKATGNFKRGNERAAQQVTKRD